MSYVVLTLGVLLWSLPHLFKRLSPARRAALGDPAKGAVALLVVLSLVLMTVGYRMAEGPIWWGRSPMLVGINNLLMLFSIYLFAASGMKTAITRHIRHPQLTGVKTWALAHLLINGDPASLILFGGIFAWAVISVILINRAEGRDWARPDPAPRTKEIAALGGTVVVYAGIAGVHYLLGVPAFG